MWYAAEMAQDFMFLVRHLSTALLSSAKMNSYDVRYQQI